MQKYQIEIKNSDIDTIVMLSRQIPEFNNPHGPKEYKKRLIGVPHLIQVAYINDDLAGFKVGYEREDYFYSWMGAVLPSHRRMGVAEALADAQEAFALANDYTEIRFRTRNGFSNMLRFGLKRGFQIIELEKRNRIDEHRIVLSKKVKGTKSPF